MYDDAELRHAAEFLAGLEQNLASPLTDTGGWRTLLHHTGVQSRRGFNLRAPHPLRFSFLQRVRV
jgi:hypothetical protein